ncbi:glycosyltransferase [Sphingobium yanoikuyae]|uniref:glycosyltransferase n=1 Tax=Sphingobium yanoikuyae TaxID=13690 RepID=UPI0028ACCF21|nr:glycosyltransferase [Sphingobium yanoikuyae]
MHAPSVSVVINTFNRAGQLVSALRGLRGVQYDNFEVVVINGPSTDATEQVLANYKGALKKGDCPVANLSMSRNAGITMASGDIVVFLDDDAVPHPLWLQNLVKPYLDPDVGAVGGYTIDNTGVRWQVKKTICDRFGDAYFIDEFFDERLLNRKGTPYYPSILGANSSFRASYLREVGGFDETYAYFLDETDVCLRVIDAGYKVIYEPKAVIYHQSAASDLRSPEKIPSTLRPSVVSKSYFIVRHGAAQSVSEAAKRIEAYRAELLQANHWLANNGRITWEHKASLDDDVRTGIEVGMARARARGSHIAGDLKETTPPSFLPFETRIGMRIVLVSRGLPPRVDAGIARWTKMLAEGLAKRGHEVHIITEAEKEEATEYVDGIWIHSVAITEDGDSVALKYDLPGNISSWAKRVWREVQYIKSFGLDVLSFPIWDLEGIANIDDDSVACVMSLHTSFALAKPFKPEWKNRPIFEHFMVNRMIKGEKFALANAPTILANSNAIVEDMVAAYGIDFSDRMMLAPHGTNDLLDDPELLDPQVDITSTRPLKLLFVGRFEPRKGFDVAAGIAKSIAATGCNVEMTFAGGDIEEIEHYYAADYDALMANPALTFEGKLSRAGLDDLYRECDVVLMPSRYESFGLVAIEGMSAGKPVVALSVGGLKEVVTDGYNGYCVADDEKAAETCFAHIMELSKNRKLLAALSANARQDYLDRFSIDAMAEAVEKVYKSAIEKRKIEA